MFRILVALLPLLMLPYGAAQAQTASEIPLENPEILKPDARPKGISPPPPDKKQAEANQQDLNNGAGEVAKHQSMTRDRVVEILQALDPEAKIAPRQMQITINDVAVIVILDPINNRMRAFSPVRSLDGVDQRALYRMLQANFDAALDARYAIAREYILSVFIHPLGELKKNQLIEGLGQVVNLVKTYGTSFTSGAVTFGGGDSNKLHRKLIDNLLKKGEQI